MKTILIQRLSIDNFKGANNVVVYLNGNNTRIDGANGSGKSTIVDAFSWCLFGKNAQDQTEGAKGFDIKPQDPQGNPRHHLTTRVVMDLTIDNEPITLRREYEEQWTKQRGKAEAELKGHVTNYFINDVPVKAKQYDERIAEICPVDLFQLLTQPSKFFCMKTDAQRELLVKMAGVPTLEEIATGNQAFNDMLQLLAGKDLQEFKMQIAYEKKNLKKQLEEFGPQIRGVESTRPEPAKATADELNDRRKTLMDLIANTTPNNDMANQKRIATMQAQKAEIMQRMTLEMAEHQKHVDNATQALAQARGEHDKVAHKLDITKTEIATLTKTNDQAQAMIDSTAEAIASAESQAQELRNMWVEINNRQFTTSFTGKCPFSGESCVKAVMPKERIDAEREAWQAQKQEDQQANETAGRAKVAEINKMKTSLETMRTNVANNAIRIAELGEIQESLLSRERETAKAMIDAENALKRAQFDMTQHTAGEHANNQKAVDALTAEIAQANKPAQHNEQQQEWANELQAVERQLHDINTNALIDRKINELQAEERKTGEQLAELETKEYTIGQMIHAQMDELERRVNALFGGSMNWRMYEQQLNGGETPACTCTVNGVRYNDINTASKIAVNMKLGEILMVHNNVAVPMFIDNAECITTLPSIQTQVVALYVNPSALNITVSNN